MPGNRIGGQKAAKTNKERYGDNFYRNIGRKGGLVVGKPAGFASEKVGKDGLTGRQRAKLAGAIGGKKSRRTGVCNGQGKKANKEIDDIEKVLEEEAEGGRD